MINESTLYEKKRQQGWIHKLNLDSMTSFNSQVDYFIKNIDPYVHSIVFAEGEHSPFRVEVKPQTADDRQILYHSLIDYWRKQIAEEGWPVHAFNQYKNGKNQVAFVVIPFESLKADFEERLATISRKHDAIDAERRFITKCIDEAGQTVINRSGDRCSPPLSEVISDLRRHLDTAKPQKFTTWDEIDYTVEALKIAQVWDIVHYEAYLKDMLEQPSKWVNSPTGVKYNSFSELFDDPKTENTCVDVLRKYRPEKPIIGDGLNWTGNDKGIIVGWIEQMEGKKRPKIKHLKNRKILVELLNAYFKNLDMGKGARVFGNTVHKNVKDRLSALMPD